MHFLVEVTHVLDTEGYESWMGGLGAKWRCDSEMMRWIDVSLMQITREV